ncbi:hypothetical protein NQ318_012678 [Aromia moschata]|uniref:Uncharacterized protein n=1 Tax=Aromia moschata TaxID=1265417 RepID=A0AAV8YHR9_9CUCU|nr:hypothetical protein NQ318_012678 [Aromia moschata]
MIYEVCKLSNETGNIAPDLATLRRWDLEGRATGSVGNARRNGPRVLEEVAQIEIQLPQSEKLENHIDQHDNPFLQEDLLHFQRDGARMHYTEPVRDWLNVTFLDRWIGGRRSIERPVRSPDLSPNDFLWSYLKSVDLQNRMTAACTAIKRERFQKVREEFKHRVLYCMERSATDIKLLCCGHFGQQQQFFQLCASDEHVDDLCYP